MKRFLLIMLLLCGTALPEQAAGWMAGLDDSLKVSALSIPGTHNSGALREIIRGTAKCQNMTIKEQLKIGIRSLDIRCRHYKDSFRIYHGFVNQKLDFNDVVEDCADFLEENPSECILMTIKEEYRPRYNTRSFEQTFRASIKKTEGIWHLGDNIPSLSQARGKIILLRRFHAAGSCGIDVSSWQNNAVFTSGSGNVKVQDCYVVKSAAEKWKATSSFFDKARTASHSELFINMASGVSRKVFKIPRITQVAEDLNRRLNEYFLDAPSGRYGVVSMDFATPDTCKLIIKTNSHHH